VLDHEEFARHVREALDHLYDSVYLQNSPLIRLLSVPSGRAQDLRRRLIDAIETLQPPPDSPSLVAAERYRILYHRFIEGLSAQEVANELALSKSQFYREQKEALDAVVALLWEQGSSSQPSPVEADDDLPHSIAAETRRMSEQAHPTRISLGDLLAEAATALEPLARACLATFETHLPVDPPLIFADRVMTRQVLINALAAMLEASAGACVSATASAHAGQAMIEIVSSGAQALDLASTRLAVSRRLVELQGGTLTVLDAPARLRFTWPMARAARVLVIDDNPDLIDLFQRYLAGAPFAIIGATSGVQGLQLARNDPPDLIILDVMMPSQDGWEILQALHDAPETRAIPVLVCSVLNDASLARAMGAAGLIPKPVTQQALLAQLAPWR
jgi:CheY-like chemotaxis protein